MMGRGGMWDGMFLQRGDNTTGTEESSSIPIPGIHHEFNLN